MLDQASSTPVGPETLERFAAEVAQANLGCHLQELGLHMVAAQLYELLDKVIELEQP